MQFHVSCILLLYCIVISADISISHSHRDCTGYKLNHGHNFFLYVTSLVNYYFCVCVCGGGGGGAGESVFQGHSRIAKII